MMIGREYFCLALGVIVACWGPTYAREQSPVPFFNVRDLTGWMPMGVRGGQSGGDWIVRDGQLICDGGDFSWLRSDQMYADFVPELEFKVPTQANSRILVRRLEGDFPSLEIQPIGTDYSADPKIDGAKQTGAIFGCIGPKINVQRGAEKWNAMQIRCEAPVSSGL